MPYGPESLRRLVNEPDHGTGRIFAISIQLLIILSMVTFSIDTIPNLDPTARYWLGVIETATVIIFSVEYLLRLWFAPDKLKFIFSFFGLVDLLAILPFYLSLGVDLRALRAFRLLRLARILKLARYNAAIQRFHRAIIIAREEIVLFFSITVILLFLAAVGIYYFENEAQPDKFSSVFDSLWWAVVTLTTVGYGDCFPVTVGGKVFTFLVLLTGLGIVALPTGIVASALGQARLAPGDDNIAAPQQEGS